MLLRRTCHGLTSAAHARPGRFIEAPLPSFLKSCVLSRQYSDEPKSPYDIGILGGGISGLASAYYLHKELPDAPITIYEASDRLGGWLQSPRVPVSDGHVLFEGALRTFRPDNNGKLAVQLIQELDLIKDTIFTPKTSPAARNRYVYYPDHLVRMPHPSFGIFSNLYKLFTEPVFNGALGSMLREPGVDVRDASVRDESIGDFISRRFCRNVVDRLLSAIIHGIYAGDVWKLSAKSLFPRLWWDEMDRGSVFAGAIRGSTQGIPMTQRDANFVQDMAKYAWNPELALLMSQTSVFTFRNGSQMLADSLVDYLKGTGMVTFKPNSTVQSCETTVETARKVHVRTQDGVVTDHTHVVSALSPAHLGKVVNDPALSTVEIPTVTVMTVNLYFKTPDMHPPGFGYLIPQGTSFEHNPERALGVVFDTAYSPRPYAATEVSQRPELFGQSTPDEFMMLNSTGHSLAQDSVSKRGTKVTVMLGGHWWDGWPAYPDQEEGLALAKSLLQRHLGITEEPEAWRVNLQRDCIPQYTVGHQDRLKEMHNSLWHKYRGALRVTGNWINGVGGNDCLRSAYELARSWKKQGTGLESVGEPIEVRVRTAPKK